MYASSRSSIRSMECVAQVMHRIEGLNGLKLPWEGTLSTAVRRQLGIFRGQVLRLLSRDAGQRLSMDEFCICRTVASHAWIDTERLLAAQVLNYRRPFTECDYLRLMMTVSWHVHWEVLEHVAQYPTAWMFYIVIIVLDVKYMHGTVLTTWYQYVFRH